MVVIDEAHTISVWGHDFRPAFRRIINLVKLLPQNLPVLATTATATMRVQQDIEEQIGGKLTTIRGSLIRNNFCLYVIKDAYGIEEDYKLPKAFIDGARPSRDQYQKVIGILKEEPLGERNLMKRTNLEKFTVELNNEWSNKIALFRENYFPVLEVKSRFSNMINGVASSFYGVSNVGNAIHRSKYDGGGDFPDFLLRLTLSAFQKNFKGMHFDMILYVPPTQSGDLVKNFASKFASIVNIPISHKLLKATQTKEQKSFHNGWLKQDNVKDAFSYASPNEIEGKNIIIMDDIFDSGATMKEIGGLLTKLGANLIVPITIAKTVGGDI